jgi:hypothetical protein
MYTSLAKYKENCFHVCQIESLSGPRKARHPETDASVLEYFKHFPVTREALMSDAEAFIWNCNIPFVLSSAV